MNKSYEELRKLQTFEERYEYLRLGGTVGRETFGFDRYMSRALYGSLNWKQVRRQVILRDDGCDLGISDRQLFGRITVHHINPIRVEDLEQRAECIFSLDNLICTGYDTHNAIHYGDASLLVRLPPPRRKGDTCPWKAS